ncbi:polyprotein [Tanacetum coccineum]
MDPNSSLGKICLGDNVIEISSDKIEGSGDWSSPEYQDTAGSKGKKVVNTFSFYMMEIDEISERYIAPCFVNGLEAYDGEINLALDENLISNEYAVKLCLDYEMRKGKKLVKKELIVALKGELYFVKFIINSKEDDVEPGVILRRSLLRLAKGIVDFGNGKILNEIRKYKRELDEKTVKEDEDAVKRIQGEALKEKDDPGAFIFPIRFEGKVNENALADTGSDMNTMPYRIYEQLGRDDLKNEDRGITMINHTQADVMGKLSNVLCQVGVTTLIAEFLILDIQIDCDSPIVVGRGFLRMISGMINTSDKKISTFDGFCHQTFRAQRSDYMRNVESDSVDEEEYMIKRNKFGAPIYGLRPAPYLNYTNPEDRSSAIQATSGTHDDEAGSSRSKGSRHETVEEGASISSPTKFLHMGGCTEMLSLEIDEMLRIKLREAESGEEIFTSVARIRAFNINEPIYAKLFHELGLYQTAELDEDGFNVTFKRGLRSDEHFNAQEYWLSISREDNLGLSRNPKSLLIQRNLS